MVYAAMESSFDMKEHPVMLGALPVSVEVVATGSASV